MVVVHVLLNYGPYGRSFSQRRGGGRGKLGEKWKTRVHNLLNYVDYVWGVLAREDAIPPVARRSLAAQAPPPGVVDAPPGRAFMFIANLADIIAEEQRQYLVA